MQESRLFKIVYYLLEKGQTTAGELAEKFEVSVRTVYRDIDALSGAGIPIYAETGRNGGIRLMNDFVLDRAVLSEEEKQEILAALQGLGAAGGVRSRETLSKLAALFHVNTESWLEVDFSRWSEDQRDNEKFECLKTAVIHRKCVKITYASSYETITERTIQPLKLVYKSKAWYLKAYCTEREDFRLFKLSRIFSWKILDESFVPRCFQEEADSMQKEYRPIKLQFPREMAYRVYDEFDRGEVTEMESGNLSVCARMPEDGWLISFLLSFGEKVEVVEPAYLKDILAQQAKVIYEKNKC